MATDGTHYSAYDPSVLEEVLNEAAWLLKHLGFAATHTVLIGGLAPSLLVLDPPQPHIGTTDLDLCLTLAIVDGDTAEYERIEVALNKAGYAPTDSTFRWKRSSGLQLEVEFSTPSRNPRSTTRPVCDLTAAPTILVKSLTKALGFWQEVSGVTVKHALWEVAVEQYGYVTMRDAKALGIGEDAVWMLAARGGLERAAHGVYRFPQLPVTERDPYMLAVLWAGTDKTCLSHDTALAVYEACDINPDRIHLTVPTARRIRRRGGELYALHQQDLATDETGWWQGIPTATLPTAIGQCIDSGVPSYLLRQALEHGRRTGDVLAGAAADLEARLEARHADS